MRTGKDRPAYSRYAALGALLGAVAFGTAADAGHLWQTFVVSGSINTTPIAIAGHNLIVGTYSGGDGVIHGFLRASDGAITPFDDPDATSGTTPTSANRSGDITGSFVGSGGHLGFLRKADGAFTAFQYASTSTYPQMINARGAIVGFSQAGSTGFAAFLRKPDGTFISILPGTNAAAVAINKAGEIAGYTVDLPMHGFVRARNGQTTQFDPPNSFITNAVSINDGGAITGISLDTNGIIHGFVREPDGTIALFDAPGGGTSAMATRPRGIDNDGNIVGCVTDDHAVSDGFVREPSGTMHVIDAPGAAASCITAISTAGKLIGQATVGAAKQGFLTLPRVWRN